MRSRSRDRLDAELAFVFVHSALENTLRKYADLSSTSTAFSGKGQTLGGSSSTNSSPPSQPKESQPGGWRLDPQVKVLLGLMGVYMLFWYLS
jgi:thioredoxin 1